MGDNTGWNWYEVRSEYWNTPSEDVYYFLDRWKKKNLKRFLDLGCGIGRHSIFFSMNGFETTGFDLSESGLEILEDKAKELGVVVKTMHSNTLDLPIAAGSIDCVLAYHSIYHTDSAGFASTIKEIHRLLCDEGEVFITLISKKHKSFTNTSLKRIDENTIMKPEEDGSLLPHFYVDYDEIEGLFKGFNIHRIRHLEDFYNDTSSWHYSVHASKL